MALNNQIVFNCDRRDASNRNRDVVNLQRIQNRKNLRVSSSSQSIPAPLQQAIDQVAMIVVAIDGQIQFISRRTEHLLNQYSLSPTSQVLPDCLHQWFQYQITQLPYNGNDPDLSSPLHLEQAGRQLVIRLLSVVSQASYVLLLEERQVPSLSIPDLELIGLTKREAEILFWVAKDKSNSDIAKLVNCREGTVRKHLEHLHRKLGVQTRTAAIIVALERLGLLQA